MAKRKGGSSLELVWTVLECRIGIIFLMGDYPRYEEGRNRFLLVRASCLEFLRVQKYLQDVQSNGWAAHIGKEAIFETEKESILNGSSRAIPEAMSLLEELERGREKTRRSDWRKCLES